MGCGIHVYVETKDSDDGLWWLQAHIKMARNYSAFGLMAGVRDTRLPPIAPVRGLPEDVSFDVAEIWSSGWVNDGHHASWLTSREIAEAYERFYKQYDEHYPDLSALGAYVITLATYRPTRVIFWFDN